MEGNNNNTKTPQNPEWPTKNGTDNPSGKGRGNNPPKNGSKPNGNGNGAEKK